jgi:vacuolar-type H+-ATPase subunit I/STV1
MPDNDNLLTPKQYAAQHQVSPQSVYARIKRGTLKTIIVDGVSYIAQPENTTVSQSTNEKSKPINPCKEIKQLYKQQIKQLNKRVKQLEKQLEKEESRKNENYEQLKDLFGLLVNNNLIAPVSKTDIIDAEVQEHKKKKKKKK